MCLIAGVPTAIIDARTYRIPNSLSLGSLAAVVLAVCLFYPTQIIACLAGAAGGFLSFWGINKVTQGKLGMGDAKYSAVIGAALGPVGWFWAVLGASLLGIIFAGVLHLAGSFSKSTRIPFAPFLFAGSVLSILLAAPLSGWLTGGQFS